MTDPFDTVREGLMNSHRDIRLVPDALAALASIEENLRHTHANLDVRIEERQAAEARIAELQTGYDALLRTAGELRERWEDSEAELTEWRTSIATEALLARAEAAEARCSEIMGQLATEAQLRDALQHIIDCADTPLMRDVLRERDEALNAARALENQPTKEAP